MTGEERKEYGMKVTQAGGSGLVVLTYDIIVKYLDDAMSALNDNDEAEYRRSLRLARALLAELTGALDMQYEISKKLMSLYIFMNKAIVRADITKDITELIRIKEMLFKLREAFAKVCEECPQEPVMDNVETVYTGYTYSKTAMNEEIYSNTNRGFTV
ncbi:MAG: flagellar protein FliS [Lachnospiraceae bacterium]|nr:flagellar protein FliS [Lachnospiraceae bacterium]